MFRLSKDGSNIAAVTYSTWMCTTRWKTEFYHEPRCDHISVAQVTQRIGNHSDLLTQKFTTEMLAISRAFRGETCRSSSPLFHLPNVWRQQSLMHHCHLSHYCCDVRQIGLCIRISFGTRLQSNQPKYSMRWWARQPSKQHYQRTSWQKILTTRYQEEPWLAQELVVTCAVKILREYSSPILLREVCSSEILLPIFATALPTKATQEDVVASFWNDHWVSCFENYFYLVKMGWQWTSRCVSVALNCHALPILSHMLEQPHMDWSLVWNHKYLVVNCATKSWGKCRNAKLTQSDLSHHLVNSRKSHSYELQWKELFLSK